MLALSMAQGLGLLAAALRAGAPAVALAGRFDWRLVKRGPLLPGLEDVAVSQGPSAGSGTGGVRTGNPAPLVGAAERRGRELPGGGEPGPGSRSRPGASRGSPPATGRDEVQRRVAGIAAGVLGSAVDPGAPLMDAGLDSLGAVEFRAELAAAFGVELAPTAVLDYPTVSALAAHIHGLCSEKSEGSGSMHAEDDGDGSSCLEEGMPAALAGVPVAAAPEPGAPIFVASTSCRFPSAVTSGE